MKKIFNSLAIIDSKTKLFLWLSWDVLFMLWDIFIIKGILGYVFAAIMLIFFVVDIMMYTENTRKK